MSASPVKRRTARQRWLRVRPAAFATMWGLCVAAALLAGPAAKAHTNRILGDSISLGFYADIVPWPERAFGDDQITWAIPGASAGTYVANCASGCPWLVGVEPGDTWWLMMGTNELDRDPNATVLSYGESLLALIDLIPSDDIRLISSPQVYQWPWLDRAAQAALLDQQAWMDHAICDLLDHVTCVADLRLVLDFTTHYHWDGIHLSDAGHQRVADVVLPPEPGAGLRLGWGLACLVLLQRCRRRARRPVISSG